MKDFKNYGHYVSQVDPLGISEGRTNFEEITDFSSLETSGIKENLWDTPIPFDFPFKSQSIRTPRQLHNHLLKLYCGKVSFEYKHILNQEA